MIQNRLTPFNSAAILIDFQKHLLSTVGSIDVKTLIENTFVLGRKLKSLGIRTILTTAGTKSFGGTFLPQLQMIFPNGRPIECNTMSVWKDRRVFNYLRRSRRQTLVVAGLWTDFCVALSAVQALESGYEV